MRKLRTYLVSFVLKLRFKLESFAHLQFSSRRLTLCVHEDEDENSLGRNIDFLFFSQSLTSYMLLQISPSPKI